MAIELVMPALSPTMEEGAIAKWLVAEGQEIRPGDVVAEIETDKATMEIEAIDEGIVQRILIPAGTDGIRVGTAIALIATDGIAIPAPAPQARAAEALAVAAADPEPAAPAYDDEIAEAPLPAMAIPPDAASPLAARVAKARQIDITVLKGSGPGGRIILADLGLAPAPILPAATAPTPAAPIESPPDAAFETVRLSSMRRTIARRLTEAKQQVPHIYLTVDIRIDALLGLRAELNRDLAPRNVKLSINDMIIRSQALALMAVPEANVRFAGDALLRFAQADIAVAVSLEGGLITPVVAGADTKSLSAISREMRDLAALAREGRLAPAQYQGGTASLSNLGMYGVRQFEAIINPPQAMILAIGQSEERVVPIDGKPGVATMMSATGSFDHRAIDGAEAARFMQAFKNLVEAPLALLA